MKEELNRLLEKIEELPAEDLVEYVMQHFSDKRLTDKYIQLIFEKISDVDEDGYGCVWAISDLEKINPAFKTTNGGSWNRKDGKLGLKYNIVKTYRNSSIDTIKLDGFNRSHQRTNRGIKPEIDKAIKKRKCVILDIGTNIETDHKNGKYNNERVNSVVLQRIEDFQPLCKTANMAKMEHCKKCTETGKRFDATVLGYSRPFIKGTESSSNCEGCYWYDPVAFNKEISKDYKPSR